MGPGLLVKPAKFSMEGLGGRVMVGLGGFLVSCFSAISSEKLLCKPSDGRDVEVSLLPLQLKILLSLRNF